MTSSQDIPAGFVDGEAVLEELLAEPGMRKAVDLLREGTAHMDRVYAEGLAEIRKLAAQTQAGLAERMGVKQAAVSRIESRGSFFHKVTPSHRVMKEAPGTWVRSGSTSGAVLICWSGRPQRTG